MNTLEQRIIDISYKHKLSHLSSCLTSVNIIDKIYTVRRQEEVRKRQVEPFILSNGHAALALYVVLEKYEGKDAEKLYLKHGTHPNRDLDDGIFCTTGSLGQGISVAVGMAIASPDRNVYVLMSDGECAEGSVWESLAIAEKLKLENLRVTVVANGYGAYGNIDVDTLDKRLMEFYPTLCIRVNVFQLPEWIQGISGHYHVMSEKEYKELGGHYETA